MLALTISIKRKKKTILNMPNEGTKIKEEDMTSKSFKKCKVKAQ